MQKQALITGATSGIGRATALRLAKEGYAVIATGRRADRLATLRAEIEAAGGRCTTLAFDVRSEEEVRRVLLELAESVASRLRRQGMKAGEVQLTVKNGEFQEYQRQCRLEPAVCDARSLYKAALELYRREDRRWAVRLLGLRAGKLVEAGAAQMSFFANTRDLEREERLETAVDALRERFGGGSVRRGTVLEKKEREGE